MSSSTPLSAKNRLDNHNSDGFDFNCFTIPSGVELFNVDRAGDIRIEIIPYTIPEGANNPFANPGQMWYERTYFVHRGIGANSETYVCPAKTYGLPCPICEMRAKINRDPDGDKELAKALNAKERQLWWIYNHAMPDKGIQLWDVSHHLFGKQLDAKARSADPGDNWEFFADPKLGFTIKATFTEKQIGAYKCYEASVIDFKRREPTMEPWILAVMNNIPAPLDKLIKVLPYAELNAIFLQQPASSTAVGNTTTTPPPVTKTAAPGFTPPPASAMPASQTIPGYTPPPTAPITPPPTTNTTPPMFLKGGSVVHPTFGPCTVFKVNTDGTATLMDADDNPHKNVAPWGEPTTPVTPPPPPAASAPAPLATGDAIMHGGVRWRVHKVAADGVVIMSPDDDIEKISFDAAQLGRVTAMTAGMYEHKPAPAGMPTTPPPTHNPPPQNTAPVTPPAPTGEVPWDEKW